MRKTLVPRIYSKVEQATITHIYISGTIGAEETFIEEIQTMKDAVEGDTIFLFINSGGGDVAAALQLVVNIYSCAATVIGCIEGTCSSAASYIFLACDNWIVNPHAFMLLHNYSAGHYGKGNDLVQAAQETHNWILEIMGDVYDPFLTEQEILSLRSTDMYLNSENISARLEKVMEHRGLEEEIAQDQKLEDLKVMYREMIKDERESNSSVEQGSSE